MREAGLSGARTPVAHARAAAWKSVLYVLGWLPLTPSVCVLVGGVSICWWWWEVLCVCVCVCTRVHMCVGTELASLEMWLGLSFPPVVGCQVPGVARQQV